MSVLEGNILFFEFLIKTEIKNALFFGQKKCQNSQSYHNAAITNEKRIVAWGLFFILTFNVTFSYLFF